VQNGAKLIRIAAFFQLADGVQAVLAGALRGAGITRFPFLVNIVAHWGMGVPVALGLTFVFGFGVAGLWWGLTLGLVVVSWCLWLRFVRMTRTAVAALEV
jgi:MATE family multidrug resistance protein